MTTSLSANHELTIVNHYPIPSAATNHGVTAWRRNDNATRLLKRATMALSQARSEHSEQSLARYSAHLCG